MDLKYDVCSSPATSHTWNTMAGMSSISSPMDVDFSYAEDVPGGHEDKFELSVDFRRALTSTPLVPATPLCALTLQEEGLTSSTLECMSISLSKDSVMSEGTPGVSPSIAASPPAGPPLGAPRLPQVESGSDFDCNGTPLRTGGRCQLLCREDGNPMKPRRRERLIHFVHHPFVMRRLFGTSMAERPGDL